MNETILLIEDNESIIMGLEYTPGSGACKACPEILSQILRIFCEIRVIPQFFDVF